MLHDPDDLGVVLSLTSQTHVLMRVEIVELTVAMRRIVWIKGSSSLSYV